ncbi:MAG: oligosaccharide flippase family protein [Bryobacteraceae bacterium]|jgi:O-antigen/teichoic acid export membrane protein
MRPNAGTVKPFEAAALREPVSLRANFASTLASNVVLAASQWALLVLIAKLGTSELLGVYAFALALVTPIAMFSHLNLRSLLATDVDRRHPFGDYLAVRLATAAIGLAAMAAVALAAQRGWESAAVALALGVALSADNVSDVYYGLLQRRERMDQVAYSVTARGVLSVAGLGAVLWTTGSLVWAVVALAAARIAVLLAYDIPVASVGESLKRTGVSVQAGILRTSLPLGAVLMLIALTSSLPRYAIEQKLGAGALGAFAAVASLMTVGSTAVNALGQAATPRLARYCSARDLAAFGRLAWQLAGMALLLGAAGVATAALVGPWFLGRIYRPAYAAYAGLLVWVMAAGIGSYTASALGYAITSARAFAPQAPLHAAVAVSAGIASWLLVPRLGLSGAALALAIASLVQIAGDLFILRRALREVAA